MATIGFGDLRPASRLGRALTSLCACLGVGLLGGLVSGIVNEALGRDRETSLGGGVDGTESTATEAGGGSAASARREVWQYLVSRAWVQVGLLLGVGTVGFKLCERGATTWLQAAYLVTGAMTTAGLGDAVPSTRLAKLFIALYSPLAVITFARVIGALAVRPLEAARRAAQRRVLERYGAQLTRETLAEIASGPTVKRLGLSSDDRYCSRDEFTLLTLVLQGKVSEADLAECRAAFSRLDVTESGMLSVEDLELIAQRRMLRLQLDPRYRRLRLARLRSALGLSPRRRPPGAAANATTTTGVAAGAAAAAALTGATTVATTVLIAPTRSAAATVKETVEQWFPYWQKATGDAEVTEADEAEAEDVDSDAEQAEVWDEMPQPYLTIDYE